MSTQRLSHNEIRNIAHDLKIEYGLTSESCIIIVRLSKDPTIHVVTIKGYERMMPKLPGTYKGCIIEQSKDGRPLMCVA